MTWACHDLGSTSERRKGQGTGHGTGMEPTLAIVGIFLVAVVLGSQAQAQAQAPAQSTQWCAYFTGGPTNCGFSTFEECLKAIKGKTGLCNQSPQNAPSPPDDQSAPAHHRQHRLHRAHPRPKKTAASETETPPRGRGTADPGEIGTETESGQ
jgi:hypothetical protein